jgi:Cof subfamily protein (haloacid dehalogenase superfamily)
VTQRYALFFDIDGTLVSFQTHEIPPSTILALTQAKANGSRVYIATGRPPIIITNLGAIEHLIDGYITTNGALCFVGHEMVTCQPIAKDDVMTCIEDCQEKGNCLIVIGRKDVAVIDPKGDVDRIFRQMLAVKNLDKASPLDVVLQQDILQLTPFFPADYEPVLMASMPQCVSGRWHPEFTDITANGADKGKGILAMARHEGFDPSRTMAFGDGGNDTSMILQAGIGVAMGNAIDALKQQADYVTTSVDDDGILNALRHFNVI